MEATNLTVTTSCIQTMVSMDEVKILIPEPQETKLVGKEADQVGGCRSEVVAEAKEAELTLDWPDEEKEWFDFMWKSAPDWRTISQSQTLPERQMNKVPEKFRSKGKLGKFYKPSAVSIGPYHFGSHFKTDQGNKLKPIMAGLFSHVQCAAQADANFFDEFAKKIKGVRDQYNEESIKHISEK